MSEVRAAGWYPDPDDDSSERWWGGTAWTASSRPLNHTPAQAPPPPLPTVDTPPPAGWYPDPQNAVGEKWFDGADWTQAARQRPSHHYAGAPGQRASAPGRTRFRVGNTYRMMIFLPLIVLGIIFTGAGLSIFASMRTPANMSATTTGTVVSLQVLEEGSSSGAACVPVAAFYVGGELYTATTSEEVSPCHWAVGQSVAVAYDPDIPAQATIPASSWLQAMVLGFAGVGVLLLAGGIYSFVRFRRSGRLADAQGETQMGRPGVTHEGPV